MPGGAKVITITDRKLNIGHADRIVGYTGDNRVEVRIFELARHYDNIDMGEFDFKLDTEIASVKNIIDLVKDVSGDKIVLAWVIEQGHILTPGRMSIQIRAFAGETVKWHSAQDYVLIQPSINGPEGYISPLPSEFEQMEVRVTTAKNEAVEAAQEASGQAGIATTKAGEAANSAEAASASANEALASGNAAKAFAEDAQDAYEAFTTEEVARQTAEGLRKEAEEARSAAESLRSTAEEARAEAETGRTNAEELRIGAEIARETAFAEALDDFIAETERVESLYPERLTDVESIVASIVIEEGQSWEEI